MSHSNRMPSGARRFGYIITILINLALLYAANHLLEWNVPYLTEDYNLCLWAINLSFGVTIFINFIFVVFDRRWFRSLMESINSVFSFISGFVFYRVFPLDLPEGIARWANTALVILLVVILISILAQLFNAVKYYRRDSME